MWCFAAGRHSCRFAALSFLAWLLSSTGLVRAEPLPLPGGDTLEAPWQAVSNLSRGPSTTASANRCRVANDPEVGRALVVGPFLVGSYSTRAEYRKPFPRGDVEVRGLYRTVDVLPFMTAVRCECTDSAGKRTALHSYSVAPSATWKPFCFRFDKFPEGTSWLTFGFGLRMQTQGEVWFANLEVLPAGPHPLAALPEPKLTRAVPPPPQKGTGFWRVERFGDAWWLIDPEGRPDFSRGITLPNPSKAGQWSLEVGDSLVSQVRGWGFDGLAVWTPLKAYACYNDTVRQQGRRPIAQFGMFRYSYCPKRVGEFDFLMDDEGHTIGGEHAYADPFDPRFDVACQKWAAELVAYVKDDPNFVGWVCDNEIGVGGLNRYLWSEHCGNALVAFLKDRYASIEALNEKWGTSYASFEALRSAKPQPPVAQGPIYDDYIAFERRLYKRYIDVTLHASRQADPKHLIGSTCHNMGSLENWWRYIELCSVYDFVGVNLYPDNQTPGVGENGLLALREVARRTGRPLLVEWGVPAIDSGLYEKRKAANLDFSYPEALPNQAIRGRQAAHLAADLYNEPYVIGSHWFSYVDPDDATREANRGLVRSDGRPYDEMVRELTAFHRAVEAQLDASRKKAND